MSGDHNRSGDAVGHSRPPRHSRFVKGKSGNPRGRPRGRKAQLPYDAVLGQMVTVREDGRERRITAAEAFVLQLTKRGLEGDGTAMRASLGALETARASRAAQDATSDIEITIRVVAAGSVGAALEDINAATTLQPNHEDKAWLKIAPWLVQLALGRLERELTNDEQRIVVDATKQPHKVDWPDWWAVRS